MGNRRSNKGFRRSGGFVPRYREITESPAYRDLKPVARCLLDELQALCFPIERNGWISLSTANAAKLLKADEGTILKAFRALESHGFLVLMKDQIWQQRKAREWQITYLPYKDQKPTDEWRAWPQRIVK